MKHAKTFLTKGMLFLLFILGGLLYSQESLSQTKVTGKVIDTRGETLIGVSVQVKGTTVGTITDLDGKYSINVSNPQSTLVYSYMGFVTQEIPFGGKTTIDVTLAERNEALNEVVVVGYGTQKKVSISAAVSQISGDELIKAPAANVSNLLGGRLPGVVALQQSGQPGADAASILVRGSDVKYIVDGFERDITEVNPNDIETISVLKDASSAAVYGLNASSVIIVTTKRGQNAPSRINFNASYGVSTNALMLEMLDGPGYAYWYNKALEMDGNSPFFTSNHVQKMIDGVDGWGNTNWYKKTFGTGNNSNINVDASGGTDKIKYFASINNFSQKGNVANFDYDRISVRSNIDAQVAKNLKLTFDMHGRVELRDRPYYSAAPGDWNNIGQQALRALPFVPETYEGLPISTPTNSAYVNPLSSTDQSGYYKSRKNIIETNLALNYDMPFLKGLSARFAISYDYADLMTKQFSTPYQTYVASLQTNDPSKDIEYRKSWDYRGNEASLTEGLSHTRKVTTNTSISYKGKFDLHDISALVLAETVRGSANSFGITGHGYDILALDELKYTNIIKKNSAATGMSSENRLAGYLARLNYGYADKYLVELTSRYDGSYVFGGKNIDGKRWVLTPAGSLAWRISEEGWFRNALPNVDNLKLRASVGLTALTNDLPPYFYLNTLEQINNVAIIGDKSVNGLNTSNPANINLTWAKSLQYNVGFDLTMWGGLLGAEVDVFYKYLYDLPAKVGGSYPDSFGGFYYGWDNLNKQDHKGFEFNITHRNKIGDFSYTVGLQGTYTKRRWLYYDEAANTPDWLKLTGKEVGSQIGFIAQGLFQSQEEIDNSPKIPGKEASLGDIKYLDRNGDGVVTYEQDRGYVGGSPYAKFVGGFNFFGEWKGFDLSFLLQAGLGRTVALTGTYSTGVMDNTFLTKAFYHGGNSPAFLVENSWTEDNRDAEFARLSISPKSSNNAYSSTFWYRNGDYLRLKSLQLGYTLPNKTLQSLGLKGLRIYVEGQNLLTFSELSKYNVDPEQPGVSNGYYPQQKIFSGGIKLTF